MNLETFRIFPALSASDLWFRSTSACEHVRYGFCSFHLWPRNGPEHDLPRCTPCACKEGVPLCRGSRALRWAPRASLTLLGDL